MRKSSRLTSKVSYTNLNNFTSSLNEDLKMWPLELLVSTVHAKMLAKQKIIPTSSMKNIVKGLKEIGALIKADKFVWVEELEDIHLNIENALEGLIGEDAHYLHTARSRNDQIATTGRMAVKAACLEAINAIQGMLKAVYEVAALNIDTLMPGYTHLQRAQPVRLSHHLLAYFEMFSRDKKRFMDTFDEADELPLGAGALSGTSFPIDRRFVAKELGFSRVSKNSMDAVSNRDYMTSFIFSASLCMTHLSRLAEEFVLWSSQEFGFISLPDEYKTGSSMMPQKKNPDYAELIRGRSGRTYGALINILTILKALPLTYNRDIQEDKRPFFESKDTLLSSIEVFRDMLVKTEFNKECMSFVAQKTAFLATDVADYLVKKGLPFREAYVLVKDMFLELGHDISLKEVGLKKLRSYSTLFTSSVFEIDALSSVDARSIEGGTSKKAVKLRLDEIREEMLSWP